MKEAMSNIKKHLMSGTSFMIPFVVAGGVLFAISVMLNGEGAVPETGWLAGLNQIGLAGLILFVPVLGGYIAFSIADKPGLAPGFIGAYLAKEIGAGFLGGIVAGFIAGYAVKQLKKIKIPNSYRTLGTIFLYPLGGTLIAGGAMIFILGAPIASFMNWLNGFLNSMSGAAKVPMGALLGAMVGVDMGGPINKVAYTFAQTQVDTLPYLMGGVGASGAVAGLGIFFSSVMAKKKFSKEEVYSARAAGLMGCMGIAEGLIPFAATDPLVIIPASTIGASVACAVGFGLGCLNHAPWGGFIVLPVVENKIGYFIAVVLGALTFAIIVRIFKKDYTVPSENENIEDLDLDFEVF